MQDLIFKDVQDPYARENFFRLQRFFSLVDLLSGDFKFFEVEINEANTIFLLPHGLTFVPADIIFVSVDGDFNFYFRYQEFDKTNIAIFVSGPCKLRFFAGAYRDPSYGRKVSDLTLIPPNAATGAATTWFTGVVLPVNTVGDIGDFYLNTATGDIYLKTGALTWTLSGTITANHAASSVTLDDSASANTIVGDDVQEYVDRFNEPSCAEAPSYNVNGTINYIEYFSSAVEITANRIFRVDLTYDADLQPLTEAWKAYSKADGTTVLKTVTRTYTWTAGQLTNKTQVTV